MFRDILDGVLFGFGFGLDVHVIYWMEVCLWIGLDARKVSM